MTIKVLTKRFAELALQLEQLEATRQTKHSPHYGTYEEVDPELLLGWRVKACSLIGSACGKDGGHLQAFMKAEKPAPTATNYTVFQSVRAVFLAAKEDFEGGYLVSVRNLVQAEVAGSEIDQATELWESGYTTAAAVVAGVILETTLRCLCEANGLSIGKLNKMNDDLAKAGIYNSLKHKRITSLAAVRNSAAHGKTDEFAAQDVKAMIADVQRFAEEAFS
ncbi:DUF4145 domain-containing protein [Limnohabitans sp. JirII-29]|uniref:DUF4145 domain-containing protein n=1 Tax=Limnohabitans sp. JirII-29 TaxID=1835756 RepID=UPI000D38A788|nr:DUF4145 domain-containing protein [Limnohabitans sp. JirII-29]PUE30177.1 DUF4145 domain-containing protein [Limnohabitans sp. JirII-29]